MVRTIADQFAEVLATAGVKRVYGIVGDSLNGLTDSLRRQGKIEWIHVRHEEVAAFAAGAEAHLTGELAVCAGSCGPGNLHLINGLFDCHRSRVPVLAIAAQIPSAEIGSGYFQETHPEILFKECSHYCELVSGADEMPRTLEIAIREAVGKRGVSVVVMPGDVAMQPAAEAPPPNVVGLLPPYPVVLPAYQDLERLAKLLNEDSRVTILCGYGCKDAHEQLLALGERLQAPMVHTMRGKEYVEWHNPYDVGMTGLIGFSSGYYAMLDCTELENPNFANMAKQVGIRAIRLEDAGGVEEGIAESLALDGPVLVDVVVNRTELAMPPSITVEMAKGFTLYMVKAILSGRGDEVIDLARTNLWR